MEKIKAFLISFLALIAFFSLYIGGLFAYVFMFLFVLYAAFELVGTFRNKKHHPH